MAGWRDRARPAQARAPGGSWRDRASSAGSPQPDDATNAVAVQQQEPVLVSSGRGDSGGTSAGEAFLTGVTRLGGYIDEAMGALNAVYPASPPSPGGPGGTAAQNYRGMRDTVQAHEDRVAQDQPLPYGAGAVIDAALTTVAGGAPASAVKAAKAVGATQKAAQVAKTVAQGAGTGAVTALGESRADLTRGNFEGAARDMKRGAAFGAGASLIGVAAVKALSSAGRAGLEFGRGRLFKSAVGQNKRAFTQINGKGLMEKAGEYLDEMGIGAGDSTESIFAKLGRRNDMLTAGTDDILSGLDAAAPGGAVNVKQVAQRVRETVAAKFKNSAADRDVYKEILDDADAIEAGMGAEKLSFSAAAAERRAFQNKVNYDNFNKRTAAAEARAEIAKIWNEEIDKAAEPLLVKAGKAKDAYKELRHEQALVLEMQKHARSRVEGNAANKWASPSDWGAAGIAGIMTGNPLLGLSAAAANHIARKYGNAALGRQTINFARIMSASPKAVGAGAPAAAQRIAAGRMQPAYAEDDYPSPQTVAGR